MAFLLPENIPSRSDVPERIQNIARDFRELLDDDVIVWLEGLDTEPYLLLLDPANGVFIVDCPTVKIRKASALLGRREVESAAVNTLLDARLAELQGKIAVEARLSELPIVQVLALPGVSREDLANTISSDDLARCLTADDLESSVDLRASLERMAGRGESMDMTVDRVDVLRGLINPTIVIEDYAPDQGEQLVFRPPDDMEEDLVRVLDRTQERLAMYLGDGYRVIRGVAGSGKTLVLTTRARNLASNFPQLRILLVCYNIVLSKALAESVKDCPSITVKTIDSFTSSILRGSFSLPRDDAGWDAARLRAVEKLRTDKSIERYDVVLVDEAQDFDHQQLEIAYGLLKPERDSFVLSIDNAQNIYRRRTRWNPPTQTARGRTTVLRLNYRNTREILEFAMRFLTLRAEAQIDDDTFDDPDLIVPPEASQRRGPVPQVFACANRAAEAEKAADLVKKLLAGGVSPDSIALVFGSETMQKALYRTFTNHGLPYFCISFNRKSKIEAISTKKVVRASTPQSLKGLEFPYVVLCGVNEFQQRDGDDAESVRRLVYVSMTRATDQLAVTVSGNGPLADVLTRI